MLSKLASHLMLSRHGIYYLRIERDGKERRKSLRTRDPLKARAAAWKFGATIYNMSTKVPDDLFSNPSEENIKLQKIILDEIEAEFLKNNQLKESQDIQVQQYSKQDLIHEVFTRLLAAQQQPNQNPNISQPISAISITVIDACKTYMEARKGQITEGTVRYVAVLLQ